MSDIRSMAVQWSTGDFLDDVLVAVREQNDPVVRRQLEVLWGMLGSGGGEDVEELDELVLGRLDTECVEVTRMVRRGPFSVPVTVKVIRSKSQYNNNNNGGK